MILKIIPRDDESGILDGEFRDGDIVAAYLDADEGTLGSIEKQTNLFVKVPDPPNLAVFMTEVVRSEYGIAASASEDPPVKNKRKFRLDWRSKFNQVEIDLITNAGGLSQLPDGATSNGGTATAGVVDGLFTVQDLIRK